MRTILELCLNLRSSFNRKLRRMCQLKALASKPQWTLQSTRSRKMQTTLAFRC